MSVYSTIYVTRERAKAMVHAFVETCTDEELGDMADVVVRDQLHNVVVTDYPPLPK